MRVTMAADLVAFDSLAEAIEHARMGDEFVAKRGERPMVTGYAFDRTRLVLDLERSVDGKTGAPEQLLIEIVQAPGDPSAFTLPARFLPASARVMIEPEYAPAGDARVELQFNSGTEYWRPDDIGRQLIGRRLYNVFRNTPLLFVYVEGLDVLMLYALREIDSGRLRLYWEFSD